MLSVATIENEPPPRPCKAPSSADAPTSEEEVHEAKAAPLVVPSVAEPAAARDAGATRAAWQAAFDFGIASGDMASKGHCWSEAPASQFKVRSRYYMTKGSKLKGKKLPSMPAACRLKHMLLIPASEKLHNIAGRWPIPAAAAGAQPWVLINFLIPPVGGGSSRLNLVLVFERDPSADEPLEAHDRQSFDGMLSRCMEAPASGNAVDGFLAQRVKILPYLTDGASFLTSKLVNNQPGLISAALETAQYNGDGYVEVDIDVDALKGGAFSSLAKRIIDVVTPRVSSYVVDLAFMMQGEEEAELPERLIGSCRLIRLDLASAAKASPALLPRLSRYASTREVLGMAMARSRASRASSKRLLCQGAATAEPPLSQSAAD